MTNNITRWLEETQMPIQKIGYNQWLLQMSHKYCDYTVLITNHGNWISYGADLIGDVKGSDMDKFYRYVLNLNNKINGVHIAFEDDRFILIRDDFSEDVNSGNSGYNLYRSLEVFHDGHEYVYGQMLNEASRLDVFIS